MKKSKNIRPFTRQFYRGNRIRLGLIVLQSILMSVASLVLSWLLQMTIDLATGMDVGFSFWQLVMMGVGSLVLFLLVFGVAYISQPRFVAKAMAQYKEYVFDRLCKKGIAAFSEENTTLYISALSNDAASIQTNYLNNIYVIMESGLTCIGALAMMFYYSPLLTGIAIALSLLPLLGSVLTGGAMAKAEKELSDKNESFMTTLKDSLSGFTVIKSFRAEKQMGKIFAGKIKEVATAQSFRIKMHILVELLSSMAGVMVQFGVMLIGAWLALTGAGLSAGAVLIFVQLLNYVLSPIGKIPQAIAGIRSSHALIHKIADALDDNIRQDGAVEKTELTQNITLRDISFAYEPEKPVLQNVNFCFEAGKSYAIVGASGSGKSTLLNLLMASHADYTGQICYDDTDLKTIRSESLYEMVSLVQQNVFIFNASIRENITMFSSFPKEEVDRAIALSGLSDLIAERGEDYLCGENGSGLSGGEKQRISIARSLLKQSRVLLVDEATAALDAQTAFQVSNAILDLDELTRIVVTHSLDENLLKRYDCLLTMKNGRIEEAGSFDALMKTGGYFYSLYTVSQ